MARGPQVSWLLRLGAFATVVFAFATSAGAAPGAFEEALGGLSQPSSEAVTQAAQAIAIDIRATIDRFRLHVEKVQAIDPSSLLAKPSKEHA